MIPTLVGSASAIVLAVFGAAWVLSGRVARVESKLDDLPETMTLKAKLETRKQIDQHLRDYTHDRNTGVQSIPPYDSVVT